MNSSCGWRARRFQRRRQFHLDVAGGVEDERNENHAPSLLGRAIQTVAEQHLGVLDETHFDAPARMLFAPQRGEFLDFVVAFAVARTVSGEQDRRLAELSH